jgi:hypothetical protein
MRYTCIVLYTLLTDAPYNFFRCVQSSSCSLHLDVKFGLENEKINQTKSQTSTHNGIRTLLFEPFAIVVDPQWFQFNADPDLAFHLIADPDPGSQTNADPCGPGSGFGSWSDFHVRKNLILQEKSAFP